MSSIVVVSNDCKDYGHSYLIECELCPWDKIDSDESRPLNMLAIRMTNDLKDEALEYAMMNMEVMMKV